MNIYHFHFELNGPCPIVCVILMAVGMHTKLLYSFSFNLRSLATHCNTALQYSIDIAMRDMELTDAKKRIFKMHHYAGFLQTGSHLLHNGNEYNYCTDLKQKAVSTHSSLTGLISHSMPEDDHQFLQQDQPCPPYGYSTLPRMSMPPYGRRPRYPMPPPHHPPHHMIGAPPLLDMQ